MSIKRYENLRLTLEVAGGLAVLLGLIFVGLELRQNTRAMQAATFQELVHASSDFVTQIALVPEVTQIFMRGWQEPERLDADELNTFNLLQSAFWVRMQNAFVQWRRGTLTDADFAIYQRTMCGSARSPGGSVHWPDNPNLTDEFKAFLQACENQTS